MCICTCIDYSNCIIMVPLFWISVRCSYQLALAKCIHNVDINEVKIVEIATRAI